MGVHGITQHPTKPWWGSGPSTNLPFPVSFPDKLSQLPRVWLMIREHKGLVDLFPRELCSLISSVDNAPSSLSGERGHGAGGGVIYRPDEMWGG